MTDRTEALARALEGAYAVPEPDVLAGDILADPGPLLDALPADVLVEVLVRRGVLREESSFSYRMRRYVTPWDTPDA